MMKRIKNFFKRVYEIIKQPTMAILPGQLAFSLILSIIPMIAILGIIAVSLSISLEGIIDFISDTFPSKVSEILIPLINGKGFDINMLFFVITGLLLATSGAYSIIITSNLIYDIKGTNLLKRRVKSFIITLILLLLMCFLIIVPGFGDQIIKLIKLSNISDGLYSSMALIYNILKYPLSFLVIYFNIKLIYTIAPDIRVKSKNVTIGALFTSLMWILLTRFYSFYVTNIVHYDIFYGSVSNIIILLIWMYFISYIFVIGLALNAQKGYEINKEN